MYWVVEMLTVKKRRLKYLRLDRAENNPSEVRGRDYCS